MTDADKIIPLNKAALQSDYPLAREMVAAAMIWPGEPKKRQQAIDAILRHVLRDSIPAIREDNPEVVDYLASRDSPTLADLQSEIRSGLACYHGVIAGMILAYTLSNKTSAGHFSLSNAFAFVSNETLADGGVGKARFGSGTRHPKTGENIRIQKDSIKNNIWPDFRPAAHLWAAHLVLADGKAFPCTASQFPTFLAYAEAYRIAGESATPFKQSSSILKARHTLRFPEEIEAELPRLAIPILTPRIASI